VNCAASGIRFSDGERPRALSFTRCVAAVAMDGLLKRLIVQIRTGGRLRGAVRDLEDGALDLVDACQRVTPQR
jgi:hypothetical protein